MPTAAPGDIPPACAGSGSVNGTVIANAEMVVKSFI
jgi:hypothetical protein